MASDFPGQEIIVDPGLIQTVIVSYQGSLSVTVAEPSTANIASTSTESVSVQQLGVVGPPGPQGPPGTGFPSVFQVTDVGSWHQQHDFLYLPDVRLIDELGEDVEIGVEYPDANHVYIEFPTPFTGTIILS